MNPTTASVLSEGPSWFGPAAPLAVREQIAVYIDMKLGVSVADTRRLKPGFRVRDSLDDHALAPGGASIAALMHSAAMLRVIWRMDATSVMGRRT